MPDTPYSAQVLDRDSNSSSHSSHDTDSDSVNNTPYSFFQKTPNLDGITLLDLLEPASFNIDLKKKRDETYKWVQNYYKEKKKSVNLNMKKLNMSSDEFNGSIKLQHWDIMYGIFNTSILYFVWQLSYHYFITIRKADKIKKGKVTSFEYLRKAFAKKPIGKFVNSLPEPFPVVAFTIIQYGYQLITMSVCPLLYSYKHVCSLFVSFIFLCATYNGATYYVDFYGKKFQREVVKLQGEIESLQQEQGNDNEKKRDLQKDYINKEEPGDGSSKDKQRRRTTPVTVSEIIG
ncbi:hypothetical protein PMKS-002736 [Pichia membranifaciens]|uniref:Glycerophosphocholine acyltransferase 1 n=1 Tax=Pichia membranifaciens TaxID=4926 RepID=A0A1Q2YI84_9ASCO|nr:hypothetical protein PMKS-002736 [Pichia membranifaciens]